MTFAITKQILIDLLFSYTCIYYISVSWLGKGGRQAPVTSAHTIVEYQSNKCRDKSLISSNQLLTHKAYCLILLNKEHKKWFFLHFNDQNWGCKLDQVRSILPALELLPEQSRGSNPNAVKMDRPWSSCKHFNTRFSNVIACLYVIKTQNKAMQWQTCNLHWNISDWFMINKMNLNHKMYLNLCSLKSNHYYILLILMCINNKTVFNNQLFTYQYYYHTIVCQITHSIRWKCPMSR